ncbi:HD-GYP domain-containing protein [Fusibacter ferrireducens]|uniref:HD-GYP domain-containing protein n=1 Tax=Fusibacter ferrireducens TaxID=2785058 RepID=A0ABR9ZSF7_9FIRM|nr:HD-GYP domain-containing protein [Fusibacter ferrireducens]MBF4693276.1 HD-GYP domain-containing protein [Fusibacter ferrireducens]
MRKIDVNQLEEGMILGAPIVDSEGVVELLSRGTKLTKRHIALITQMGPMDIFILEHEDEAFEEIEMNVEDLAQKAKADGKAFDLEKLMKDLDEIDQHIYEPAQRSLVNANMEVNILTGEFDLPIDVRHEKTIEDNKKIFTQIQEDGVLDLNRIRKNVEKTLPDMVRNNDVLRRLNQLKNSDDYTFEHSMRVSILATMIGKWLGYSQEELVELGEAGLLFDIGKLNIPDFILKKPTQVDLEEYELIKKHAQFGYSILLKTKGVSSNIKYAALHHHERMDGSGYPLRLRENQIHDYAKIIMVCDVFDAMITDKPYKKGISPILAADYLSWSSGKLFDSKVCYIFIKKLSEYYLGKKVKLSNGQEGTIVFIDGNYPTRPLVRVGNDFINLIKDRSINVEILE